MKKLIRQITNDIILNQKNLERNVIALRARILYDSVDIDQCFASGCEEAVHFCNIVIKTSHKNIYQEYITNQLKDFFDMCVTKQLTSYTRTDFQQFLQNFLSKSSSDNLDSRKKVKTIRIQCSNNIITISKLKNITPNLSSGNKANMFYGDIITEYGDCRAKSDDIEKQVLLFLKRCRFHHVHNLNYQDFG